jgi:hypothetical protein
MRTAFVFVLAAAPFAGLSTPTPSTPVTPAPGASRSGEATPASAVSPRTVCAEWVRQSKDGYERLTLFADRNVVWKRSRDGKEDLDRKQLPADELAFYCDYFARPEVWAATEDLRSGLTGDFAAQSMITITRPDGARKTFRFDDFSPLPGEAASVRAALEGLRTSMTSPLAPASRFAPGVLSEGQLLKRFDGVLFRIRSIEREKGIVELEGVREPYRQYRKIEELRFQFSPPE